MPYRGPHLGAAAMARVKEQHSLVDVLARMDIEPPRGWDGHSDFRVAPCPCPDCPGSNTNAASFVVHPQTNRWHCFRQDTSGDVLELVCQVTAVSLWKAAKILDSGEPIVAWEGLATHAAPEGRAGVPAGAHAPQASAASEQPDLDRTPVERVHKLNAEAWRFLTLPKLADRARRYLRGRNIDVTALEKEVGRPLAGYTPMSRTGLVDHVHKKGFTDDEMVDAGWAVRRPGETELRDKYRGRVLMPVRDDQDRVVGVYGRSTTWKPGDTYPKYLNHPHTHVFDKGALLYRPSAPVLDEHATVLAVEGTLDALAIAAAAARVGASHKFAPVTQSGLSLTEKAAPTFFALHHRAPVLCGDGDAAGQQATEAWVARGMRVYHREVLTLTLPDGMDPAEWLANEGDLGLIAFTRAGSLTDEDNVRPKPAGGLLARHELARAIDIARASNPDVEAVMVAPIVLDRLAERALDVPGEAAQKRFAYAAGDELARSMDGGNAEQRAGQVRAAIERAAELREAAGTLSAHTRATVLSR